MQWVQRSGRWLGQLAQLRQVGQLADELGYATWAAAQRVELSAHRRLERVARTSREEGERGAIFVEYALAVAGIALIGIIAVRAFGLGISEVFNDLLANIRGQVPQPGGGG